MHFMRYQRSIYRQLLERKYGIRDADALPALVREFLEWRETVDIAQVFANGIAETENKDSSKDEL